MLVTFENYKKLPEIANWEEWKQQFYYIINVSQYDDYKDAINYIPPFLKHENENIQMAAFQGVDMVANRFNDMDEKVINLLFENLKSQHKFKFMLGETLNVLKSIAHFVLFFKRKIYFGFFENGFDFYTNKKLTKYTDVKQLTYLKTIEEKKEFILSFCQHSSNYNEAFNLCLNFLQEDECEELNITAIQGLTYLIMRFEQIEFTLIMPYVKKFLKDFFCLEYTDTEILLVDIAYYIPALRLQAIEMLKSIKSSYIEMYKLEEIE